MNYSKQIGTLALLQILSSQTNAVRITDDQQISGQPQGIVAFNGPVMGGVHIESNGESNQNSSPAAFNGSIMGDVNIHIENKDCEDCKDLHEDQDGESLPEEREAEQDNQQQGANDDQISEFVQEMIQGIQMTPCSVVNADNDMPPLDVMREQYAEMGISSSDINTLMDLITAKLNECALEEDLSGQQMEQLFDELINERGIEVMDIISDWFHVNSPVDDRINDDFIIYLMSMVEDWEADGAPVQCDVPSEWEQIEGMCLDLTGNQYDGWGVDDVTAGWGNGGHIELEQCKLDCLATDSCVAVNHSPAAGRCYLRTEDGGVVNIPRYESAQNGYLGVGIVATAAPQGDWVCEPNPTFGWGCNDRGYCSDYQDMVIRILEEEGWTWQQFIDHSGFNHSEMAMRAAGKAWSSCFPEWHDGEDLTGDGVVDVEDVRML